MNTDTLNAGYYIDRARQCFLLADLCRDETLADKVRELGYEFIGEAMHRGADPSGFRANWHRGRSR